MAANSVATRLPSTVITHPAKTLTTATTAIGFFALTPTPGFVPVAALLATIRLSAWTFAPRQHGYLKAGVQAVFISLAAGAAHLAPSMQALSSPNLALAVFSCVSLIASSFAVALVYASVFMNKSLSSHWARMTLFPALWASAWGFMSRVSPVGQLVTWSPVLGLGPYGWMRPVLGQWGLDWVTAAWAVVASEVLGDWLVGASDSQDTLIDEQAPLIDHDDDIAHHNAILRTSAALAATQEPVARRNGLLSLTAVLALLMVPTYFTAYLPIPTHSGATTPLSVACALPDPAASKYGNPTLSDYIAATKRMQPHANIVFWPESAVRFENPDERKTAFEQIQNVTNGGKLIGVSFEEYVPEERTRRNGFVLLPWKGPPVFEYYKRNLVPIAESFSLTPGHAAPEIFALDLAKPYKGRTVPVSASICLDFAHSSSFTSLPSRPALILAPARTWHIGVGLAMWEQAKARAAETGSSVVWCDGGEGGISGIANGAYSEIVQVGPGSWAKEIGIPHPFSEKRTFFVWGGDFAALLVVWATLGAGFVVHAISLGGTRVQGGFVAPLVQVIKFIKPARKRGAIGPTVDEQTSLLG